MSLSSFPLTEPVSISLMPEPLLCVYACKSRVCEIRHGRTKRRMNATLAAMLSQVEQVDAIVWRPSIHVVAGSVQPLCPFHPDYSTKHQASST